MSKPWIEALVDLGFTALEAEIYGALAQGEAKTGYRVAQVLGKPAANIYKALDTLHAKGAVLIDESDKKLVRAVPPRELVRALSRDFEARRRRASEALARLPPPTTDRRIYELGSAEQVYERARTMLRGARQLALLDLGCRLVRELAGELEAAAKRGVVVALRTETAIDLNGVDVVAIVPRGAAREEPWPGDWLTLVVDGVQHLLAVFDAAGELRQGTWSSSAFLSWVFHSGISAEITLDAILRRLDRRASAADVCALVDEYRTLIPADAEGRRRLIAELRASASGE